MRINLLPQTRFLQLFINPLMNMESFRPRWLFLQWAVKPLEKKKNISDQSEPHFSGESTLFSLHFPLQWGHSINHSAKRYLYSVAAKTLMSVAVRMNCHDSADLPEKVCFLFQKSQQKYLKKNVEKLIWIMKITSNWRFGHFTFTATWEMSCCNLHL